MTDDEGKGSFYADAQADAQGEYKDKGTSSYYASGDALEEQEAAETDRASAKRLDLAAFRWWEWAIIATEGLLILYTLLAVLDVVPLF